MTDKQLARLIDELTSAVAVLRTRDKLPVSEEQCRERGRNIAAMLIANYDIRPLPELREPYSGPPRPGLDYEHPQVHVDFADPRISSLPTKPIGHLDVCQCGPCQTYNRSVKS